MQSSLALTAVSCESVEQLVALRGDRSLHKHYCWTEHLLYWINRKWIQKEIWVDGLLINNHEQKKPSCVVFWMLNHMLKITCELYEIFNLFNFKEIMFRHSMPLCVVWRKRPRREWVLSVHLLGICYVLCVHFWWPNIHSVTTSIYLCRPPNHEQHFVLKITKLMTSFDIH